MKKYFTYLGLVAVWLITAYSISYGALVTVNVGPSAGTNGGLSRGQIISQVTLTAPSTNSVTVGLFDGPSSNLVFVRGVYSTFNQYMTNLTNTYIGFGGVTQVSVYPSLWTYSVTNAATTNNFAKITTIFADTNQTVVWTPLGNVVTTYGIVVTNSASDGVLLFNITPVF